MTYQITHIRTVTVAHSVTDCLVLAISVLAQLSQFYFLFATAQTHSNHCHSHMVIYLSMSLVKCTTFCLGSQ